MTEYYFADRENRKCYVVNFTPGENSKGLNATNIVLTNQIFNDNTLSSPFEVLIKDLKYYSETLTRIVSGVKNGSSIPFGASRGGHGTYRSGYPEAFKELNIHFHRIGEIGWGTIDVRDLVLNINDRSKITGQLVQKLKDKLVGKKIFITQMTSSWKLSDNTILKI